VYGPFEPDPDKIVDIPIEQLLLDVDNPRLAWRAEGTRQRDLIELLWVQMAVDEVAWSIAKNGFFRSEPLFVICSNDDERDPAKRRYTVVEGNRRMAAVLLLRDADLRQAVGATDLPEISEDRRRELGRIPAIVYPDRKSLWATVGFRHINGIQRWDSFSKAKYVAGVHESYGIRLDEIADTIGDRHATVRRLYRGYKVLEQAESEGVFDREDQSRNRFYFSHLYTAVDQKAYQDFLGIDPEEALGPNPVPERKLPELGELMTYLYGKKSEGIEPVVRKQNPDLNTLREVIGKPAALSVLRSGRSLDRAHQVAIGDRRRFLDALTNAKVELQNAKSVVTTGYAGEDEAFETMEDIISIAETVADEMARIRESARSAEAGHVSASRRRRTASHD